MPIRTVPNTASVAEPMGGKLFAPAAARNLAPLIETLARVLPEYTTQQDGDQKHALELASGTGQHVVGLANHFPGLHWTPSELAADRRQSIDLYAAEAAQHNIATALELDATQPGWSAKLGPFDLVFLSNLTHLISAGEVQTLLSETQKVLTSGGIFAVYGPFMRDGQLISDGDRRFHASIQENDPEAGYKDTTDMARWCADAGLTVKDTIDMPANNLLILAHKA